jgi:hypothetical protein
LVAKKLKDSGKGSCKRFRKDKGERFARDVNPLNPVFPSAIRSCCLSRHDVSGRCSAARSRSVMQQMSWRDRFDFYSHEFGAIRLPMRACTCQG